MTFATSNLFRYVEDASAKRRALEALPSNDYSQIEAKNRLHAEAEAAVAKVKALADCIIALELAVSMATLTTNNAPSQPTKPKWPCANHCRNSRLYAREQLGGRATFHWPVEFPEVFARGGFDAFVGNPPFIGNKYWQERLFENFQRWAELLTGGKVGKIDVVALFYRRAFALLNSAGKGGLIATTTAREGSTLQVGFAWLSRHGEVFRAVSQRQWPGDAGVHVCIVWFGKERSALPRFLDDKMVETIPPSLVGHTISGMPKPLMQAPWGFQGSDNSKGECFILTESDAWFRRLKAASSPFLRPYLTGDDIRRGTFRTHPGGALTVKTFQLSRCGIDVKRPTGSCLKQRGHSGLQTF